MGTEARIVFFADDTATARVAASAAFERVARLDELLSDYRTDSELSRLNAAAGGPPVQVSTDLFRVLSRALEIAGETDGAFDPTAGPVVALWRESRNSLALPSPDRLAAALRTTGWRNVVVDTVTRTVRLTVAGMMLDLGGIAKGYAVDEAIAALEAHGITRALIEFGGEIRATAPPPNETGWLIRMTSANVQPDTIRLAHSAVSTSGDSEQHVVIGGVRYSHVVDPRTGLGLTTGRTATVFAPLAMDSDVLVTAATVLDNEQLAALIALHPETRFTVR